VQQRGGRRPSPASKEAASVVPDPGSDPAIECVALVRRFGDVVAVDGVTFTVARGEFFALLGPNGAGKTTTVNVLTTLSAPSSGAARVLGYDVVDRPQDVRRSLGMVFQDPALDDSLTARETLALHAVLYDVPRSLRRDRIGRALSWATLEGAADRRVRTFSGGMKRRLELARALVHEPGVLLLDEPTLRLDPQGRRNLWDRIEDLRRDGMTVLMTTHYLHEAASCDRVGILDHGRLVAIGAPGDLVAAMPGADDLEAVFLALTGRALSDEPTRTRRTLPRAPS
jgi:ABC-2 type transport system ATP-binding protein